MKNLADEFRKSFDNYEILSSIGNNTWQINLKNYDKIAVLKKIDNVSVYKKLKELNIKGVPHIYNIFEKDGENYVIEEYVNGNNLSNEIASKGKFTKNEVKNIIIKLCNILSSVHNANIVHRDIKPSNIVLTNDNNIYLIDFGIARNKNDNTTSDTKHLGTEFYASPEQYGFAQTDNRSDIYSIGKLMVVLLKGKEISDRLKDIPYYKIISKCCEIDSDKRYANVSDLKLNLSIYDKIIYVIIIICVLLFIILITVLNGKNNNNEIAQIEESTKTPDIEQISEPTSENNIETTTMMVPAEISQTTTVDNAIIQNNNSKIPNKNTNTAPKQSANQSNKTEKNESQSNNSNKNSSSNNTATKKDYAENTILTNYKNDVANIYYDDVDPAKNPYINIGPWSPKQSNNINFAQGKTSNVLAEQTSKGLNITLNGQTILCPNTENVQYTQYENKRANNRVHTAVFYDFTGDGIKDIFVVETAYYIGDSVDESDVLYLSGFFIKVNSNLQMTLLGGDKLICQSGFDIVTLCSDHILTENTIGTHFVSYKIVNDKVVKYDGI